MPKYVIMTDAANDLSQRMAEDWNVVVLPMGVTVGDMEFMQYPDEREMPNTQFYARLTSGDMATTSAVSLGAWIEQMELYLREGCDVLVMPFSSGLSSTANNASLAAAELKERYPDNCVEVVDTLSATAGGAVIVHIASENRAKGMSIHENKESMDKLRHKIAHYFTVDDLGHLRRGGRISAATAVVGGALGIKPILRVDEEGKLVSVAKARGRKKSLSMLADYYEQIAQDPENGPVMISHGDCLSEAQELADELRRRCGVNDIGIIYIGPIIGAHAGPGAITLCFVGKHK